MSSRSTGKVKTRPTVIINSTGKNEAVRLMKMVMIILINSKLTEKILTLSQLTIWFQAEREGKIHLE